MALRALMLRKKIDDKRGELETLRAKDSDFEKREIDLRASIDESATEEEKAAVEMEIDKFETERSEHEGAKGSLEKEISDLEADLKNEEEKDTRQGKAPAPLKGVPKSEQREANITMNNRSIFGRMSGEERAAIFMQDDIKTWIGEIRSCIKEKRALTNVGLTIPQVFLGLLRENVTRYSKLYRYVNVQRIGGTGRQVIMGSVPEGVWTECCATLNELSLGFNDVEVDCYKVGGYFKVCNAILEDSDIDLAGTLLDAIAQAIGLALDKAILYGRNTAANYKMPLGIVSRLAQIAIPTDYPATARTWEDLHETHMITIPESATGIDLFKRIVTATGVIRGKYDRGEKVWVMNEATYAALQVEAMSINAAGAIVTGQNGTMPIVGGKIETLEFVPDNVIVGGYLRLYLLAERAGQKFAQSEHAFFIQDETVFKGTARYDGTPVIAEAFVAMGIGGVTPTADMTFAADTANTGA